MAGYTGEGRHIAQIGGSSVALTAIRIRSLYPARGAKYRRGYFATACQSRYSLPVVAVGVTRNIAFCRWD